MEKEKRGRRGGQREDAWCVKFDNVHMQLRIIIKLPVNPNTTICFYLYMGLDARAKPQEPKFKAQSWVFNEVLNPLLTSCGLLGSPKISQ